LYYRKEIDGLRAIAILPVIFFHADLFNMTGGYVGVDIFFVISGYLITSILMSELEKNEFSILNFYERRARRILPALTFVLVTSTIAAFILMPAELLKSYSESLISVVTFTSNIYFYMSSGYFSTISDETPLLHTWSLAVEEQYYIFFPIFLSLIWSIGRKKLTILILLISLLSLSFAHYLALNQYQDANFYLIFSRAWELLAGSLISIIGLDKTGVSKQSRTFFETFGLLLIIYSIFFFDKHTPFPSLYTLIPIIGTLLIISFSNERSIIGQLLSNKILVVIGLLSYSLYLWHQPLFAFIRISSIGEPSETLFLTAMSFTFLLAFLSYKYIETPFRNKKKIPRATIFQLSLGTIFLFLAIGLSGYVQNGFENRFTSSDYTKTIQPSPKRVDCHTKGENFLSPEQSCNYFKDNITWAVFGDSHTVEIAYSLAKVLEKKNQGVKHLSFSGCPPALNFDVKRPGCSRWVRSSLSFLEKDQSIKNVLLGFRYSAFLFGSQTKQYPDLPGEDPRVFYTNPENYTMNSAREVYWESLREIIIKLLNSGKNVYVLYPIPELPTHIEKLITPDSIFNDTPRIDLHNTTTSDFYMNRNKFIIEKLNSLNFGKNLYAIKPFNVLCNNNYCPTIKNGKSLYFDDNHLSISGADELIKGSEIIKNLE
jgi:peptidoglycan/LPS O-acetylase OafA/YrhL